MTVLQMNFSRPHTVQRVADMRAFIAGEPKTQREISAHFDLSIWHTCVYLNHLRKSEQAHIAKWKRLLVGTIVRAIPFYAGGPGKDARKLPPCSNRANKARARKKMVADLDAHDLLKAKRRAKEYKIERDWTAAWIPQRRAA